MIVHVGADVKDAVSGLGQVDSAVNKGGAGIGKTTALLGGLAGIGVAGFGMAVSSAMSFEGAMSDVSASLNTTSSEYDQLSQLALNIGRDTAFSATQGAQAIEELGKAGVSITDIMGGAGMAAAQLASATGSDIPTAANVMANAMNSFSLSGTEGTRVADVMTAALNESSLSMNDYAQGMANGGMAAATAGMSIEQTSAALALFSNAGLSGAEAGTALKTMLGQMANPTAEAAAMFDQLGISMQEGIDSGDLMGYTAEKLKVGLADMSESQRISALQTMFGADAWRIAAVLYGEGAAGVSDMTDKMQSNGQAAEAAQRRLGGLRGAMEQLQGSLETAFILFGSMLTPVLTKVASGVTKLMNGIVNLNPRVKTLIGAVAGGITVFAALGAGFGLLITAAGPLIAGLSAVGAGLAAIAAPVLALIAVGALLYMAWSNNWLGLRDTIGSVVGAVVGYFSTLATYISDVASGGRVLTDSLDAIPAPMRNITMLIGALVDGIIDFVNVLAGGGGITEAWNEFTDTFKTGPIQDALSGLGDQILGAFTGIDWAGIGTALLTGLTSAASAAGSFAMTLLGYLGDLTSALGGWIAEQAGAVDWAGKLSTAASLAGDITGAITGKLGDLTAAIGTWLGDQAGAVDWAGILSTAAGKAGSLVETIILKLGDLGTGLKQWYDNAINSVDWGNMGVTVGEKVGDLAQVLVPKAGELIQGFLTAVANPGLWIGIATALGALMLALPATIAYLGLTLAPKALEFLQGFATGIGLNWSVVSAALTAIPGLILGNMPALGTVLLNAGMQLLQGIVDGFNAAWPTVSGWLALMPGLILIAVSTFGTLLLAAGIALFGGLVAGFNAAWPTIQAWLSLLPGLILTGVTTFGTLLVAAGTALLSGLVSGLNAGWPMAMAWLGLLGSMAIGAVGSLASTLVSKGVQLIQGALQGLNNSWPQMRAWLGLLASLAFQAVGSLANTLVSRGVELITGALTGLNNQWPAARAWLSLLGALAFAAVGSLTGTLVSRGAELISGIYNGVVGNISRLTGLLGQVGTWASSAVGDLSGTLYGAGQSIVSGLISGITSMIDSLTSKLGELTGLISKYKGPPEKDAVLLFSNGQLIMQGLIDGIDSRTRDLIGTLQGITTDISGQGSFQASVNTAYNQGKAFGSGINNGDQSSGNVTYYDNRQFTIKVDDLPEVAQAAEFIRDLQRDHELIYGAL